MCEIVYYKANITSEQKQLFAQIFENASKLGEQGFGFYANENGNALDVVYNGCDVYKLYL